LKVFTTRADTIMGITFAAVAAEHPLAAEAAKGNAKARGLRRGMQARRRAGSRARDDGEEGVPTGLYVLHPITGEGVEVWIGNYVLMSYGEGAVMAVPGSRRARLRLREEVLPAAHPG
jgi:leucyl-tRNA synthetase